MSPAVVLLIKLAVRLVVFGAVFFVAAKKHPKILIHNKWATPLIALVFALLNTAVYWALTPILNLATLGAIGFAMPLVANVIFLLATEKLFKAIAEKRKARQPVADAKAKGKDAAAGEIKPWFEIQGFFATLWMAIFLTVAHGALWLGLDYLPSW
ncbi:MAG: phage holin family protein [Myxococcales bacterium]|nr:phage holin family protein [Myxococcales bacterium]